MRRAALALLLVAVCVATLRAIDDDWPSGGGSEEAVAQAGGLTLSATAPETGYINLRVEARPDAELTIRDEATGESRTLTPAAPETRLRRFATWRCQPRERAFTAIQAAPDGTPVTASASVRTGSCANRFALRAPKRVRAGERARVRLRDRWDLGDQAARVCTTAPGARERCRARRPGAFAYAALRAGRHRIAIATKWQRERRTLRATAAGGRLRVLATGDSMIQIIDSYLKARIGSRRVRVRSDAHISTGLSKPSMLDWQTQARRQAASRPDVVVMFIGANDGFPMAGAGCCGPAWSAEYGRRARNMMRTYARGGRARVLWLLLPAPRGGAFRETFPAVNAGLRRAARGLENDVLLVDLVEFFTPGGRYRDSMPVNGKTVRVRQGDGVHLNTAGASLAANLIIRALRRSGTL